MSYLVCTLIYFTLVEIGIYWVSLICDYLSCHFHYYYLSSMFGLRRIQNTLSHIPNDTSFIDMNTMPHIPMCVTHRCTAHSTPTSSFTNTFTCLIINTVVLKHSHPGHLLRSTPSMVCSKHAPTSSAYPSSPLITSPTHL